MSRFVRSVVAVCLTGITGITAAIVPASAGPDSPVTGPGPNDATSVLPVLWQGELWMGRETGLVRQNPNMNYWLATPETAFTDSEDRLHLVAKEYAGNWFAVGMRSDRNDYSYGTYRFVVDTGMGSLDPNAVVGMFTYNPKMLPGRGEIDTELGRWGVTDPTARNAQWVIQPYTWVGHLVPFTVPPSKPMTYEFKWKPKAVIFTARVGATPGGRVVSTWKSTFPEPGAPRPGTRVHVNLWFKKGFAPISGQQQEVVFRSFTYTPAS